jgi:positive regulator of sigma E activity
MKNWGTVRKIEGKRALVEVCGQEACQRCGSCLGAGRQRLLWAANPLAAQEGDWVCVELPTKIVLGSGIVIYLLPLVLMLVGYGIGGKLGAQIWQFLGAALGFALAVGIGSNQVLKRRGALEFTVTKVGSGGRG